jgi:hypothetical protein
MKWSWVTSGASILSNIVPESFTRPEGKRSMHTPYVLEDDLVQPHKDSTCLQSLQIYQQCLSNKYMTAIVSIYEKDEATIKNYITLY